MSDRRTLQIHSELPSPLAAGRRSAWADLNFNGRSMGSFLEGPDFDADGNMYVVDIPFGRIFCLTASGHWRVVTEYDGWPNGLKVLPGGRLVVADHKIGLIGIDIASGARDILVDSVNGDPLLGLNDLTIAGNGDLYVTDQGQTGMHDPRGRVLRITKERAVDVIISNGPSPNGLVFDAGRGWLYVAMTRANAVWRVPMVDGRASKVGIAIQLTGGIGPDGLALDPYGNLLVAHPPVGIWHFDSSNMVSTLFATEQDSYVTNLVVRHSDNRTRIFATDSRNGRIVTADLDACSDAAAARRAADSPSEVDCVKGASPSGAGMLE